MRIATSRLSLRSPLNFRASVGCDFVPGNELGPELFPGRSRVGDGGSSAREADRLISLPGILLISDLPSRRAADAAVVKLRIAGGRG
jgi:hypothetical protein